VIDLARVVPPGLLLAKQVECELAALRPGEDSSLDVTGEGGRYLLQHALERGG